jgi:hypothetical protein
MAQKRKTAPPTRVSSGSPRLGRSGLIAKEQTESNQQRGGPSLTIAFIERPWCKLRGRSRVPKPKRRRLPPMTFEEQSGELQPP